MANCDALRVWVEIRSIMLTAVALSHVIAAGFASPSLLAARPSPTAAARAPILIAMGAKKSRYADDGTREAGINIVDDESLAKGFFSNFKWGTEVDNAKRGEIVEVRGAKLEAKVVEATFFEHVMASRLQAKFRNRKMRRALEEAALAASAQ